MVFFLEDSKRLGTHGPYAVYFHIKFAKDENGTGLSEDSTLPFIGCYVSSMQADISDPIWYTWCKRTELSPEEGIMATWYDNKDFVYYLHLAYAGDSNGTDFTFTKGDAARYIGYYIDNISKSSVYSGDYEFIIMPDKT